MGVEGIFSVLIKVAAGVGAILLTALGWSIRQILSDLRGQLVALQGLTGTYGRQLERGDERMKAIEGRVERLEKHDEDRCKTCRWEAAQFSPSLTPPPGRG